MIKKIWHDPVWSKVIATAILAGSGWIAYRLNWLPVWMTQTIAQLWLYLLSPRTIPHWLFILLILAALVATLCVLLLIWESLVSKKPAFPQWTAYTTDLFDGLRWRWQYDRHEIVHLFSFCPTCDFQVYPDSTYRFATSVIFNCDHCHRLLGIHEGSFGSLESTVTRLIQRNLRTGDWSSRVADET